MNQLTLFGIYLIGFTLVNAQLFPYQPGPFFNRLTTTPNEPPNTQITVTCFSNGISPGQCPTPGRIIEARVISQRSGSCRVYNTFGFVGNYLWVRDGCGGQFSVRYATNELSPNYRYQQQQQQQGYYPNNINYPYNQPTTNQNCANYNARYACASVNRGYNLCKVPYEIVRVDVKQAYGGASCQFATSYGRTEQGKIWVTNGCSAQFDVTLKVCQGSGDTNCKVSSTLVDCRARGAYSEVTECELPLRVNSVQLQNQRTALHCNQNSYGQTANGVWVNNGCYGTFDVSCQICQPR